MRVLLDINVVLDVLLERDPFFDISSRVWGASDRREIVGCVCLFSIPTIHYLCRRYAGKLAADAAVDLCVEAFELLPISREAIGKARQLDGPDFEDCLQAACAMSAAVGTVVTRNVKDFGRLPLRAITPETLLVELDRK